MWSVWYVFQYLLYLAPSAIEIGFKRMYKLEAFYQLLNNRVKKRAQPLSGVWSMEYLGSRETFSSVWHSINRNDLNNRYAEIITKRPQDHETQTCI